MNSHYEKSHKINLKELEPTITNSPNLSIRSN
jgi:hypothetical protein